MRIVIKNIRFYQGHVLVVKDLLIENERIAEIGDDINQLVDDYVIDGTNKFLSPGLIDVHTHTRTPGFEYKEDIQSFTNAAIKGGIITVCAMANTSPIPDSAEKFIEIQTQNQRNSLINIHQMCAATIDLTSDTLVDFKKINDVGVKFYSNDGFGIQKKHTMQKIMEQISKYDALISIHLQTDAIKKEGVMDKTKFAINNFIPTFSAKSEYQQLKRDLSIIRKTAGRYHVGHLTSRKSVDLIRQAKQDGIQITFEVTPNHIVMNSSQINHNNGIFKINPPIRKLQDQNALIEGLIDGTIDCIATDHAPHAKYEKNTSIKKAAFGMIGLEFAFSLMYTFLVKTKKITLKELIDKMHTNPNQIFRFNNNIIQVGEIANLVIWDLNKKYEINKNDFESKSSNTPFLGYEVYGRNIFTIINGKVAYQTKE